MRGKIIKLFRCPECSLNKRVEVPLKRAPNCPKCGSGRAYYSDDWHIAFTLGGKQKLESVSPFKDIAEKRLTELKYKISEETYTEKVKGLTWEKACELFWTHIDNTAKVGTKRYYKEKLVALKKNLPLVEGFPTNIDQITPNIVGSYMKMRLKSVTNTTVNREVTTLKHIFNCLSDGKIVTSNQKPYLRSNPIKIVKTLQENDERDLFWTADAVNVLLNQTTYGFVRAYILMASDAGLRKNTIKLFRRRFVNLEGKRLEIPASSRKRGKYTHYVSLSKRLLAELSALPASESEWLFPSHEDNTKVWGGFEGCWRRLKEKVGETELRFHDLKHTAGTLFYEATEDIRATAEFLDHADLNMTRKYARMSDKKRSADMSKFEALLG